MKKGKTRNPIVGIIMGSKSDLPCMQEAAEILEILKIPYEMKVVSAHRTPKLMYQYAGAARDRGLKVIIAGAGGAAHLPGMVASLTTLPVVGVPVRSKTMDGLDSLLSMAQMPAGIPIATVAVDNGQNAGLLAARILGIDNHVIAASLERFHKNLTGKVLRTTL